MWSVVWALLPKRYLIGAGAAIAALLLVVFAFRQTYQRGANAGYSAGYNHAVVVELLKQQVLQDSVEMLTDARTAEANHNAALVRDTVQAKLRTLAASPRVRVDTVAVATAPSVPMVSVFVESDSLSYPTHPRLAQLLVWQDSVIHLELVPLIQRQSIVIAQLDTALSGEHAARLGADSLGAQWRLRALSNVAPPKAGMSWSGKALHAIAWAGATLIVANQFRHR